MEFCKRLNLYKILSLAYIVFIPLISSASAQVLPSSADAGRIVNEERNILPEEPKDGQFAIPNAPYSSPVPESAKNINFTLNEVIIEGMTVFNTSQTEKIYVQYLNTKVSLSVAWEIADAITKLYRDAGYFLSRAYVPGQSVKRMAK